MEKLKMHAPDLTAEKIRQIADLLPNCVTESQASDGTIRPAIDFDQLRQELSDHIVEGPTERYKLDWPGKREAILTANAPIAKTLRPWRQKSVDFDKTKNLFIEGDNLDALKLLQETYLGKVKLIYIDPPYNTGNDFVYRDAFAQDSETYFLQSNQKDAEGNRLVANTDSNGRFHSDWLTMMYSRLRLARNLLKDDGVIFVSIDDGEVHNLRSICNEIFGQENFIADIIWESAGKNDARQIGINHEYILTFAKDRNRTKREWTVAKVGVEPILREVARLRKEFGDDFDGASEAMANWYKANKSKPSYAHRRYRYIDKNGLYKEENPTQPGGRKFDLKNPMTGETIKLTKGRGWGFDQTQFNELVRQGRISFISSDSIMLRLYLHETVTLTPQSVLYQPTRSATERLAKLLGATYFEFPKDENVIRMLVEMASSEEDVIMDFFAGSGTTAHAVLMQNAIDRHRRRFVLVQLPEPLDSGKFSTIASISRERIRLAGNKIRAELGVNADDLDAGFRVLTVDTSNMRDVYYTPDQVQQADLHGHLDNIKAERSPEDLLFQVLLDWGIDLASPIATEAIDDKKVFFVDGNALAACFDTGLTDELVRVIAQRKPLRAVFRDASYGSDAVKINVEQIFKFYSPETEVRAL